MSPSIPDDPFRPLRTSEWLVTLLICAIPLVGIVMMFVWAFSEGNVGRRNLFRAYLLLAAIAMALGLIIALGMLVFGGLLAAAASHTSGL
jgi:hypothetical protein